MASISVAREGSTSVEREGVVGPANHAGKRDVLAGPPPI